MQKKTARFLAIALIALLLVSCWGCGSGEDRENYKLGEAALRAGRLADAAGYFGAANGYKDSEEQLLTIYFEAMNLYEAGSCAEAADVFTILSQYEIEESGVYARVCGAYACLDKLDAAGAYALLDGADPAHEEVVAVRALLELVCFADTVLIRPEYVAEELIRGSVVPEVSNVSDIPATDEILYAMTSRDTDSVYAQYREYCMNAFPDSFADESGNYFSFVIGERTYYVTNFYSLDGGMAITIPRY